eukprot:TRINITY_DN2258_c1_g1_i1.p1 TRINITY_DN2258_c1_g1~~TRINITY_DN2258_c1_g1_i1.p1  ORF type:complete len:1160 (-),score=185.00 TRINITY_DN2258_c1_g1_i1:305-3673(-)
MLPTFSAMKVGFAVKQSSFLRFTRHSPYAVGNGNFVKLSNSKYVCKKRRFSSQSHLRGPLLTRAVIAEEPKVVDETESQSKGIPTTELTVGVPKETKEGEKRIAATPDTVKQLVKAGYNVVIEKDAGMYASFSDEMFESAGAKIVDKATLFSQADIVLKVRPPFEEAAMLKEGSTVISFIQPAQNEELVKELQKKNVTVFALDQMPRTLSRAQAFDVLSSMANIAGYRAVVEASNEFGRFFAGQFTAAGKIPPAKVLVIGAGVAGLAAIQQAKNMGAIVRAFDVRSSVKEQIQSVGAEFLEVKITEEGEGSGGYAKEMSKEFIDAEMELFRQQARDVDIIITTALIPGRRAPILITKDMIESMKPGSVVVDLAAENGGNIETIRPNEIYEYSGVTHVGITDLPSRMPAQSSTLFANNVTKYLLSMGEKGMFYIDHEDEAVRGAMVLEKGVMMWPPPKKETPPPPPSTESETTTDTTATPAVVEEPPVPNIFVQRLGEVAMTGLMVSALLAIGAYGGKALTDMFSTLALACLAGSQVVYGVTPALHSPLMSVTNAISGMTAVGGIILMGGTVVPQTISQYLAAGAVLISMVNVAGGFVMTQRMLGMFKIKDAEEDASNKYSFLNVLPAFLFLGLYVYGMSQGLSNLNEMAYLISGLCCISAIGGLATQETAAFGNTIGAAGVAGGLVATLGITQFSQAVYKQIAAVMLTGCVIGASIANNIQVTSLPQLVAAFHSLVGLAACATAFGSQLVVGDHSSIVHSISTFIASVVGAVTVSGSIVAFGKLQGIMSGKPLKFQGQNVLNFGLVAATGYMLYKFVIQKASEVMATMSYLGGATAIALLLGWLVTSQVGGADMPVVITLLNSASGWALCAEGFVLDNNLLTIVGALIGSSGAILSDIMCKAMNRSILEVLSITQKPKPKAVEGAGFCAITGECTETSVDEVGAQLATAKKVVIVPGYGVAVSKGQYALAEMMSLLGASNVDCKVCIHPVAGRMPGQLNVLLAEAGIPYDKVFEMEEMNEPEDWSDVDLALVVGANDTVNSAAEDDPNSPIAGMPVIRVWKANRVVVLKRSMGTGYAALENPVFYNDNTDMLLGDARCSLELLRDKLRDIYEGICVLPGTLS